MNLETHISDQLWDAIGAAYQAGNFSHAVLEALHFVTETLRQKSGIDADGVQLVGQALGGDNPKLRINAFQTETEKNTQRGIEQILRGIYTGIRNPRSHEQFKDPQADADAIILFVDYILRILDASKEVFTIDSFLQSLNDPEFVESERYAELLVAEIPTNRRGDALASIFENRQTIGIPKLRFVVGSLTTLLNEAQLAQYMAAVSEQFRTTSDAGAIRTAIMMLTPELWPRLSETARLRIENKLIREITQGKVNAGGKVSGGLGTFARKFLRRFVLRTEGAEVLIEKLDTFDEDERRYVAKYFFPSLPEILTDESEMKRAVRAISSAIKGWEDVAMRDATISSVRGFPTEWQNEFVEALKDMTNPSNPAVVLNDGTPLLEAPAEISDDDIPF
jgi:uncharacterized protein (TIGR02391 family)